MRLAMILWLALLAGACEPEQGEAAVEPADAPPAVVDGPPGAPPNDETQVRELIAAIYDGYAAGMGQMPEISIYTPEVEAALGRQGEGLAADPFCQCQDFEDTSYEIRSVSVAGDAADVQVSFANFGGEPVPVQIALARTPVGWRVADVRSGDGAGLRSEIGL